MPYETITYDKAGRTVVITLGRPNVYNALNDRCVRELEEAYSRADADPEVRAIIIAGSHRYFCAGADITDIKKFDGAESAVAFSRKYQLLFQQIESCRKPTIAAIEGFALGGGCELVLSCDVRIMGESGQLGLPEIDIGAFPAGGGTQRLPRLVGMARATEILITGRRIAAQEAADLGLATRVVADGTALDEARAWAALVHSKSPTAIAAMKQAMRRGADLDLSAALKVEAEVFGDLSTHPNFTEGIAAFLEKRAPDFADD
ncbi:MAG: enoyl-CoA hydratase/isomerase family protein [Actinobacteria bacterium]|nr:enoyl-CoA hydratase/isomerase family protein [Actinomycetota bacterium]